ncbi:hypothetical protein HMPREF3293_03128 [Christensenella minuta]|uniref:Uncharacterized protein n=1 Tax=Christensenella minuta TaxID=626937 RepID=A0A136Q061_9FIRM|nr:hypothetical protein HMPREF3293_03128 [Christensenella minuta]
MAVLPSGNAFIITFIFWKGNVYLPFRDSLELRGIKEVRQRKGRFQEWIGLLP